MENFIMKRLICSIAVLAVLGGYTTTFAADHLDSPAVSSNGSTDITDLFAWANEDGTKTNLIMNVRADGPDAAFSDAAQYVFHVGSSAGFGADEETSSAVMCTFSEDGMIQCWAGDEYVMGDPSDPAGLTSESGKLKVFAGPRNDPFFFPLEGFQAVVETVISVAGDLMFDESGCPALDEATAGLLVSTLTTLDGNQRPDTFAASNVLSLAVQVDTSLLNAGGSTLAVWASTRRAAE
jgi:hypothetical protein